MADTTTIQVSIETWRHLQRLKDPGDSFDDVIRRQLNLEEQEQDQQPDQQDASERPPEPDPKPQCGDPLRDRAVDALEKLQIPGRASAVEQTRREAILWAWEWLREQGEANPQEIADATFYEFQNEQIDYSESSGRYPGWQLWDNCLREALRELPGVTPQSQHWNFEESNAR